MKKIIAVLLVVVLAISCCIIPASAVPDPNWTNRKYGDINYDLEVTVADATIIQRKVAELIELDYNTNLFADYDHDGVVSVADATCVQKRAAEMELPEEYGGVIDTYYTRVYGITSDPPITNDKTLKGVPITFKAYSGGDIYRTYEFFVNDELVSQRSFTDSFTYTFEQPGDYRIECRVYNEAGYYNEYTGNVYILNDLWFGFVAGYDNTGTWYTMELVPHKATAPYKYIYRLENGTEGEGKGLSQAQLDAYNKFASENDTDWQLKYDEDNNAYLYRESSEDNDKVLQSAMLDPDGSKYQLTIKLTDSKNLESNESTLELQCSNIK